VTPQVRIFIFDMSDLRIGAHSHVRVGVLTGFVYPGRGFECWLAPEDGRYWTFSNADKYRFVADAAAGSHRSSLPLKFADVVLDVDPTVPYVHVVGIIDACIEQGFRSFRFDRSPRFVYLD
jgi:hypothetical protein